MSGIERRGQGIRDALAGELPVNPATSTPTPPTTDRLVEPAGARVRCVYGRPHVNDATTLNCVLARPDRSSSWCALCLHREYEALQRELAALKAGDGR